MQRVLLLVAVLCSALAMPGCFGGPAGAGVIPSDSIGQPVRGVTLYLDPAEDSISTTPPPTEMGTAFFTHTCPTGPVDLACRISTMVWNSSAAINPGAVVDASVVVSTHPPEDVTVWLHFFANETWMGEGKGVAAAEDMTFLPGLHSGAQAEFSFSLESGLATYELLTVELWLSGSAQFFVGKGADPSIGSRLHLDLLFPSPPADSGEEQTG